MLKAAEELGMKGLVTYGSLELAEKIDEAITLL